MESYFCHIPSVKYSLQYRPVAISTYGRIAPCSNLIRKGYFPMPKLYKGRKAKRSKVGKRVHTVKDKIARNYDLDVEISPDFLPKPVDRSALEDASSRVTSPFAHYPGTMGSSRTRKPPKEGQYLAKFKKDREYMLELAALIRRGAPQDQIDKKRRKLEAHRSRLGTIATEIAKDGHYIAIGSKVPDKR